MLIWLADFAMYNTILEVFFEHRDDQINGNEISIYG